MCKTVENSVDCAENLHIPAKIRLFFVHLCIKCCGKLVREVLVLLLCFLLSFYNFYKTIDFL